MSAEPRVEPAADDATDDHGAVALGENALGQRLRQLRRGRGLSLADVAEGTGISASFLSMVEKGQSDITVSRLMRLVRWFGVSIADLVQEPDPATVHVVRADQRRSLRLVDEGIAIEMLTTDGGHRMMPVVNVYAEGGAMAEPARHEGEEFVLVVDGRVELTVGDGDPIELGPGDSAHYRSDLPHSFRNVGRGEARFIGVTTPPNL
ncbi:MAG TPA: cupin domain-containing protein [Gaiella sp.]|jgi:transcriptional regulator with XRE-family HTH domain|nr:cupin domain-containing protein [Gaiella sp.]